MAPPGSLKTWTSFIEDPRTTSVGSPLPWHRIPPISRRAPPGLPFAWDDRTIRRGLNFTLTTDLGPIDLLGEIVGGGGYDALLPDCITIKVFGVACQCLGLPRLIQVKRAAGRPRDLEAVAELEAILEERSALDEP